MAVGQGAVVASARVLLNVDDRKFKTGMKSAERDVDSFGRSAAASMSGFAKAALVTAGAAGIGAVVLGAKSAITAASNLGEQINKVSVVFRGSEREVLAWSKTTAQGLGISSRAALEAAGTFGNMLVPMGFARDRAAEMSTTMVDLAADMASFNNADPTEVLDALRSGLAGETEPLRRFGIFLNDARLKQEAMNMGLYDGKGALDASAKAAATYAIILKDTKDAQGDFGKTSGSLANQTGILKAQVEDLSAKAGKVLLPAVVALMTKFNELITRLSKSKEAQELLNDAMEIGTGVVRGLAGAARDLAPTILSIVRAINGMVKAIGGWETAAKAALGVWIFSRLAALRAAFVATAGAQGIGAATTAISGKGGLAASLRSLPKTVQIAVVLVGAAAAYATLKELFGMAANLDPLSAQGDLLPDGWHYSNGGSERVMYRNGRPVLGTRQVKINGKWQAARPQGEAVARAAIQGGGGAQVGSPGGGTHSRSERGYIWQDDDAWDIEVKPNTIIVAVEAGQIRRLRYGGDSGRFSGWGFTLYGRAGTYFYKHLRDIFCTNGQWVKVGQPLGRGSTTGHLHFAVKPGTEPETTAPPPPPAATGSGSAAPPPTTDSGDTGDMPSTSIIPAKLELKLVKAELSKRLDDDLRVLKEVERYLVKRSKAEKDINAKILILRELQSVRDRIGAIEEEIEGDEAGGGELLPGWLSKKLKKAGLTKRINDDLEVLEQIRRYYTRLLRDDEKNAVLLEKLLAVKKRITKLKKAIAAEQRKKAVGQGKTAEEALAEPEPPGPEDEHPKGPGLIGLGPLTGKETITQIKAQIERLKEYRRLLIAALKKVDKEIAAEKAHIARLNATPPRRRTKNWSKVMADALKNLAELRADRASLIAQVKAVDESLAELAEAANSQPDPEGADGGAGEGELGEEPDGEGGGLSQEDVRRLAEQNVLAYFGARTDLTKNWASNVIAAAFAGGLGALPGDDPFRGPGGHDHGHGGNLVVNNNYAAPPPDPHTWSKQLEWELKMGMI